MKHPKPQPIVVRTLCSLCDEEWEAHGDDPTTLDCIRLLKAAKVKPYPYVPNPWWWQTSSGTISVAGNGTSNTVTYLTPRDDDGPEAVGAVA